MNSDKTDISKYILNAAVPEHSACFMEALSGGRAFSEQGYLFLHAEDWLMGIGYPAAQLPVGTPGASRVFPAYIPDTMGRNESAFSAALDAALRKTNAVQCWAVAPSLPERLRPFTENEDCFYALDASSPVPAALRGPVTAAAKKLAVTEDNVFSAAHRRLWAEFLARVQLRPNIRELYARTEALLAASGAAAQEGDKKYFDIRLLNAWDADGNLAASLLLDYSPGGFCSYIIGAHSRRHYSPHATDLLFVRLLEKAREEGKSYIHLGLGVNEGITRFKKKWGGQAVLPYVMASWRETPAAGGGRSLSPSGDSILSMAVSTLLSPSSGMTKQQLFDSFPQQRDFAMIFSVRKGNRRSWLCGSAHFFRYSFEFAFRDLFAPLHTVVFEGPLDEDFLLAVEQSGKNPDPGEARIIDAMTEEECARLERTVNGPKGILYRLLGMERPGGANVKTLLADARPWYAFFSLWVAYLERQGWHGSVDLEAWRTAKDMGKAVIAMENLEEQLDSLQSVPIPRIVDFFRRCDQWPSYIRRNIRTYLNGDLSGMMGSSIEFPSRTEMVIDRRDERFRQRMRPFLEAGDCAVFVGTAHLLGLIPMLRQDGFVVQPHYPTFRLKLRAAARDTFSSGISK